MSVLIKGMEMPESCGDCPLCTFTADEKKYIGYCNTSDDDYYCKALDRFMEYDKVDGGVDILGKPEDCPLIEIPIPHRRLIEEPETLCYAGLAKISPYDFRGVAEYFCKQVRARQTVLEAEE